jgi:hypothetical protein
MIYDMPVASHIISPDAIRHATFAQVYKVMFILELRAN